MMGLGLALGFQNSTVNSLVNIVAPLVMSAVNVGQDIEDTANYAAMTASGNFDPVEDGVTVSGVVVSAIGVASTTTALAKGDVVGFSVLVTLSDGKTQTVSSTRYTMPYDAPVAGTLASVTEPQGSGSVIVDASAGFTLDGPHTYTSEIGTVAGSNITIPLTDLVNGSFDVTATNNVGQSATASLSVTIYEAGTLPSTLTITELDDRRVYQRSSASGGVDGKGQQTVSLDVNLASDVTTLQYRIRRASGGVAVDWTTYATNQLAGDITLDLVVPATLGWVHLDVRADDEIPAQSVSKIAVGRVIAIVGQSLAVRMFADVNSLPETITGSGVTISDNGSVFATYRSNPRTLTTPSWQLPADVGDYDVAGGALLLANQIDDAGVNCALVGHASGSRQIADFITTGQEADEVAAVMNAVEGFETMIWFQGHSDADLGTGAVTYKARLDTMRAEMVAYNAVMGGSFDMVVCTIPNINSSDWGTADQIQVIREAAQEWTEVDNSHGEYVQPSDIDLADGVHQSIAGGMDLARHFDRAMSGSNVGPVITSATREVNNIDITLPVTLPAGATALVATGNPEDRFAVFPSGTKTGALALNATTPITVGTSSITLHLAAENTSSIDVYYGFSPETVNDGGADVIRSNDTADGYAEGRTLSTTIVPLTIAGLAAPAPDLTASGAAYEASDSGWDQRLSSGYAYSASTDDNLPTGDVWTAEIRVNQSASTGTSVMLGFNQKLWLGVNTQGRLLIRFRNSADAYVYIGDSTTASEGTNPVVDDGTSHIIAIVSDGTESRAYFDGALVGTGPAGLDGPASSPMYVANLSPTALQFEYEGSVDQVALWSAVKYTGASYTLPTAPYDGTEADLVALYAFDGDATAT